MRIIFLLFFASFLLGADLNQTIIDANTSFYKELLNKLPHNKNTTDNTLLQRTILTTLIHNNNTKIKISAKSVENVHTLDAYKNLFATYLQNFIALQDLQDKLKNVNKNIATINEEINKSDSKNSLLLTSELQAAFYHKKQVHLKNAIVLLTNEQNALQRAMQASLNNFSIDKASINKKIIATKKQLLSSQNKMDHLVIRIQQEELLNRNQTAQMLKNQYKNQQQYHHTLATHLLEKKFLLFSAYLQEKNSKIFDLQKEIIEDANKYKIIAKKQINESFAPFLLTLETKFMGKIKTITGSSEQEAKAVLHSTWQMLQLPLFHINTTSVSIIKLFITFMIFIIGFIVGHIYKKNIQSIGQKSKTITASTLTLLSNLGYYTIFLITFFVVLKFLGIDLSSIALVAGALSVGIGFGLQNIISNFVSGIILMVERSMKIGDYIQLDENLRGRVVDIKMRSITIVTNSNIDIIVPNLDLIQQKVINWTMNDKIRRFEIPFGVAYGSDAKKVISVILQAVKESGFKNIYTDRNKITRVIMTEMGDSSVNFELFVWIRGIETLYPKRTTSEFLLLIYETLNANGIEIPFPQRDLHIKSIQTEIPISIQKER